MAEKVFCSECLAGEDGVCRRWPLAAINISGSSPSPICPPGHFCFEGIKKVVEQPQQEDLLQEG